MTATIASVAPAAPSAKPDSAKGTYLASVSSEWTKLRSVRSTVYSLAATIGITVGLGALFCAAAMARWDRFDRIDIIRFDGTSRSLRGIFLAQLAIGVLGVLVIGAEYTTGAIRTTFAATPRRRSVIAAKATVLGVVAFVVSSVGTFTAFFIGQSILTQHHVGSSIGDPSVLRAVLGGSVYLTAVAIIGFSLATVLRRTPGAIAALFAVVLVLPLLSNALPDPWNTDVAKLLPATAGESLFSVIGGSDLLSTGRALLTLGIWVVGTFSLALFAINRRDT